MKKSMRMFFLLKYSLEYVINLFWLQDIKYVLLRLQKAITRVEQGMKVASFSSDVENYENDGYNIQDIHGNNANFVQELGMEGFQTEAGGFVHDKPGVGITGFQVYKICFRSNNFFLLLFNRDLVQENNENLITLHVTGAICPGITRNCTNW